MYSPSTDIPGPTELKVSRILDPHYPLCREDMIWILEFVKQRIAEMEPSTSNISTPRILQMFNDYAQAATAVIHGRHEISQETEQLRLLLSQSLSY